MAKLLIYYAHPGHSHSRVNRAMAEMASKVEGVTFCDLYATYPRFNIDIDKEQEKLLNHDVFLFQHPLFWYSTPPLVKEWIDLVLEHGFAYGSGGDKLHGKTMMNAISAAGPEEAYTEKGYQHYSLRTFLTPLEQTARLCHMNYSAPYVLYSSLKVNEDQDIPQHVQGYKMLIESIRDDHFDFEKAFSTDVLNATNLPMRHEV